MEKVLNKVKLPAPYLLQVDYAKDKLAAFSRIVTSFRKQRARNLALFGGQLEVLATRHWTFLEASHHTRTEAALPFTIIHHLQLY